MSQAYGQRDLSEGFQEFLNGAAKLVFILGGAATLISVGLLIFTCFRVGDAAAGVAVADAAKNVDIFQKILMVGAIGLGVGAAFSYWGEEILGAILLILAGALYFAPLYMPSFLSNSSAAVVGRAMGAIQQGGMILGAIAIVVLVVDLTTRVRNRSKNGTKADQLKYGKGVKEEAGTQNVFMGKCWQLPFCRKFVRERCPIYHSKRTCWKELVGCMCEEQVIRNAMENKPIPKDALLAGNMIPRNSRLNDAQKRERCKNCIIYNEHQRHKYKLTMPSVVGALGLIYVLGRPVLVPATENTVRAINTVVQKGTLGAVPSKAPPVVFTELLLAVFFVIALTYSMKVVEYLIFKLKV
ncbi:MAG: hypothetical protein ACO1SV_03940 [Fimbriimonas sp.]